MRTTPRQKAAVHFCEQWLDIEFKWDINNPIIVSKFLSIFLDEAKRLHEEAEREYLELKAEYESYLWDKL